MIELLNKDFFEAVKEVEDNSVHLVICDPPYDGQTPLEWDKEVDLEELFRQLFRVIVEDGVILIFGQEPFSSRVRLSKLSSYKYDWYWQKERLTNVFQVKRRPGKVVENIMVFFNKPGRYFPQKSHHDGPLISNKVGVKGYFTKTLSGTDKKYKPITYNDDRTRHPVQVLKFQRDYVGRGIHPTQKPLKLIDYIIKTYTKPGEFVLDPFAGSGVVGCACKALGRLYRGFEIDPRYWEAAVKRLENSPDTA